MKVKCIKSSKIIKSDYYDNPDRIMIGVDIATYVDMFENNYAEITGHDFDWDKDGDVWNKASLELDYLVEDVFIKKFGHPVEEYHSDNAYCVTFWGDKNDPDDIKMLEDIQRHSEDDWIDNERMTCVLRDEQYIGGGKIDSFCNEWGDMGGALVGSLDVTVDFPEEFSLDNLYPVQNSRKPVKSAKTIKSSRKLRIINSDWEKVRTKTVKDYDGFTTDYTMYKNPEGQYIFMMGDTDIYGPDPDYADWECESEEEAIEWFDDYRGPGDDEIASSRRKEMKVKTIKSAKHILKSGYYNNDEHPEGGGTCDYCGAEIAPGDGYEQDFQSTQDTAAYYLFIALGGDENRAYMVTENQYNFVRWLQGADEDIDEDWLEDVIREIISAAFDDKDGYMCSTCLEQRVKKSAEEWVAENW